MKKLLVILLMFNLTFLQEPCEGTCLSEEESINLTEKVQKMEFDLDKYLKINKNLDDQLKLYMNKDSLNVSQIEDYMRLIKLKDEMIKVVKPKWYENKWIWFGLGVAATATSVKLAGEIVD